MIPFFRLLFFLFTSVVISSCSRLSLLMFIKPPAAFREAKTPLAPDYSNRKNWHKSELMEKEKKLDLFYLHPTTYIVGKGWNQDLENKHVNWRTRVLPIAYQASTFFEDCNVYIPKYRQAIFYSFFDKKDNGKKALDVAYHDVRNAFYYYLEHYNKGKPFVFASHSQGSYHSQKLLAEVLMDSFVRSKLVVAYIVGWPVKESYLNNNKHLKICSSKTETGCLVSWNTESGQPNLSLVREMAKENAVICVNPLSWNIDTAYVNKNKNKGSLQYNKRTKENEIILYYCDAQIQDGILKVTPPSNQKQLQMPMGKGNYHLYDYNFFYQNIKQNVRDRFYFYTQNEKF
jgi:hypothetical protein